MGRTGYVLALAVAFVLALPSCIKDRPSHGADLEVGDKLPEFTVTMADGSSMATADLIGSVSCLVFFHTGCPDCQQTMPLVQRLYETYSEDGVKFLCISREEGAESIAAYWSQNGFTLNYSPQEDRAVYNLFATYAVPRIYISDPEGVITAIHTDSPIPTWEELVTEIEALL